MVLSLLLLSGLSAFAGSGDPVDGHPNALERDLHLWTNAARLAPHAFAKDAEQGGCSVSEWANARAVAPLRWNHALGVVARSHSADMEGTGQLTHDSSDGTSMVDRIQAVYGFDKAFAENVARGYPEGRMAVLSGWMCSEGHRVSLLDPRFDEVGLGAVEGWFTQDFGDGGWSPEAINSATHEVSDPQTSLTLWTDVWSEAGVAPSQVRAVVDGRDVDLQLIVGSPDRGVWGGFAEIDGRCTPWFVEAVWADRTARWPATGSYAVGPCPYDDAGAEWMALQVEGGDGPFDPDWVGPEDPDEGEDSDVSSPRVTNLCATSPVTASWLVLALGGLVIRRRARVR